MYWVFLSIIREFLVGVWKNCLLDLVMSNCRSLWDPGSTYLLGFSIYHQEILSRLARSLEVVGFHSRASVSTLSRWFCA